MLSSCSNPVFCMGVGVDKIDTYTQPSKPNILSCVETRTLLHTKQSITTLPIHMAICNFLSVIHHSSTLSTLPIMKTTNLYKGLI